MGNYTRTYNPQPTQRVGSADLKAEFQAIENAFNTESTEAERTLRQTGGSAVNALPNAASRALKVLSFDASGHPITSIATVDLAAAVTAATTATTQAGIATTQAGIATTGAGTATTQAGIATTQAGIATTQVALATTQAGIATTQAGIATTQAGLATTNGAAQVALATTQATNASNSATAASGSATTASGHATTASGHATTASGHATTATTQAGIATTQAGIATTKAGEASTSASSASTSAGTATTQAGIATTKAGEANASAIAAAASAASISDGPVTSVNGMTGVVVISDPAATEQTTTLLTLPVAASSSNDASTSGVVLDATRTLLLITDSAALHAVVHDSTADTYGTVVLVRTATMNTSGKAQAALVATDKVLCISVNSTTGLEAVVLTISGTTVTVGTAATATLASNVMSYSWGPLVTVGTSYVIPYGRGSSVSGLRAVTVSGTTATIGSELALSGNTGYQAAVGIDSTKLLALSNSATTTYWQPVTVSGTTLTAGTQATATSDASLYYYPRLTAFATGGRFASLYTNTATYGAVVTVSGTTATVSTVSLTSTGDQTTKASLVTGNQLVVVTQGGQANVLTDSSGTAVAGTAVTLSAPAGAAYYGSNYVWVHSASGNRITKIGLSGNNPAVQDVRAMPSATPAMVFGDQEGTLSAPGWYLQGANTSTTLNMQSAVTLAVTSSGVVTHSTYTGLRIASSGPWHKVSAGVAWIAMPVTSSTACRLSKVVME